METRLNKFIAQHSSHSRRDADALISAGRVRINGVPAPIGSRVKLDDAIDIDGTPLGRATPTYIALHKPAGYVCSRNGQGASTIYELLPKKYHDLTTVGRLDKDSSGLILLTNDGDFSHSMTHPSFHKTKTYTVCLDAPLTLDDERAITRGIVLDDGLSRLQLKQTHADRTEWRIAMHEGRNRQIRRTFAAAGYTVTDLHRTEFGAFRLNGLQSGEYKEISVL